GVPLRPAPGTSLQRRRAEEVGRAPAAAARRGHRPLRVFPPRGRTHCAGVRSPAARATLGRVSAFVATILAAAATWWAPPSSATLQLQFSSLPVDTSVAASVYDIDLFDNS